MKKYYDIFYNDNVYYGSMIFTNKTQTEIEKAIQAEINDNNNKNINPLYHIGRNSFKEVQHN